MKGAKPPAIRARGEKLVSPPILAISVIVIGRRPDGRSDQDLVLPAPGIAPPAIHADGEVADEADAHADRSRGLLRGSGRAVGQPLQEDVEVDLAPLSGREGCDRGVGRVPPCAWPGAPAQGGGVFAQTRRIKDFEAGMLQQKIAAIQAKALQVGRDVTSQDRAEVVVFDIIEQGA